jgi:hypothetical protein
MRPNASKWSVKMIYIIKASFDGSHVYKIGFTRGSVKERLKQLQTASPIKLSIVKEFRGDLMEEQRIHNYLVTLRSHGEWFNHGPLIEPFLERENGTSPFDTACPRKEFMKRMSS